MFRHQLKLTFRNIKNHPSFSAINVAGLAVGMACAILILFWVRDEVNYDHFHENIDRIHRVVNEYDGYRVPTTPGPMAAYLEAEIPEIEEATRFKNDRAILQYGENIIRADGVNAEPEFLDVFTFPEIAGDCKTALDHPGSIVLTASTAEKLFGEADPLGKVIKISNRWEARVAGIVEDVPSNSSPPLQFDYLQPFKIYYPWRQPDSWEASSDYQTWVLLDDNSTLATVNGKINDLIRRHQSDPKLRIFLQPLKEIHLRANTHRWDGPHGDIKYVYIFSLLAIVILAVACINFMNLATARSMQRAKEVGVRKVVGANRRQLMGQFLTESFMLTFAAIPIAALFIKLALPTFNRIAGKNLAVSFAEPWILWGLFGLVIFTGLFAGIYPALYLSDFHPVRGLKSFSTPGRFNPASGTSFRRALVVTQFVLSIIAIVCTIAIYNQMEYVRNKRLGFDKENLVYVPLGGNYSQSSYDALKSDLRQQPSIVSVGGSGQIPIDTDFIPVTKWYDGGAEQSGSFTTFLVDEDFLTTYQMELATGRFFSEEFATDGAGSFVINEAAAEAMMMENPVGRRLDVYNRTGTIIGVVKNFHFETLRKEIDPAIMMYEPQPQFLNIRIRPEQTLATISTVEELVKKHYPAIAFEIHFLDDQIETLYATDYKTEQIFTLFSVIAIFLSCMGLYALASFAVEQKTKEIGIRKVIGASVVGIVTMLSSDYLRWILVANLIAWPVAWFAVEIWLQNFAYSVNLTIWPFFLAGFTALTIALLTVSWQAIRAATANPVEALRYE